MVFNNPMPKKECETMRNKLLKYEQNKYYRFSIECIEEWSETMQENTKIIIAQKNKRLEEPQGTRLEE